MKIHELKCEPAAFNAIVAGVKTFTVRKNDRGYEAGDTAILHKWDQAAYEAMRANPPPSSYDHEGTASAAGYGHTHRGDTPVDTSGSVTTVIVFLLPLDEVPDLAAALDAPDGAWVVLGIKVVGA